MAIGFIDKYSDLSGKTDFIIPPVSRGIIGYVKKNAAMLDLSEPIYGGSHHPSCSSYLRWHS